MNGTFIKQSYIDTLCQSNWCEAPLINRQP